MKQTGLDPNQVSIVSKSYSLTISLMTTELANIKMFDEKILSKYDVPAPRYTSYPTAPQFHSSFGENQYEQHAERSNSILLPKDLSIYVHIPFCHSLCHFCGCNKIVTKAGGQKVEDYIERLMIEIAMRGRLFNDDRLVTQIHFGGGTPNFLKPNQLAEILEEVATHFHLDLPPNLDISIEVDPRSISPLEIEELSKIGFNRFSIGVQDFTKSVQTAINREQSESDTLACIEEAMRLSDSVNVDLITGLPAQTPQSFEQTLSKVINTGVTRIAAYSFAYLPERIKAQRMIDERSIPDAGMRLQTIQLTRNTLHQACYRHIGMDHYALPEDRLAKAQSSKMLQRNFQGYSTHKDTDLIGIGVSAISKFDTAYSQNTNTLSYYSEMIDSQRLPIVKGLALTEDDRLRAAVIQEIMCHNNVDLNQKVGAFIERNSEMLLLDYFKDELESLNEFISDGLINPTKTGFDVSDEGRYFVRPIAAVFDRYLSNGTKKNLGTVKFSKTI